MNRKQEALKRLTAIGKRVVDDIKNNRFPALEIPSRSVDNIIYDTKLRQYILGDEKIVRNAKNIKHLRAFTQLLWIAYFSKELLKNNKTSTLRDIYYSAQAYHVDFEDQDESDEMITELESIIKMPREDFNIYPEERSAIFGDLTIEYTVPGYEGKKLVLTTHPDGVMIGPALTTANFIKTSADKVIVIEKGALFTRFIEEKVYEKYKSILIATAGQAPRSTRYLIRRLNRELGLPVYIFTDADPWGMHIAMVIISGSANAAHVTDLVTPDAKWAGVWASDIKYYKLPSDPLTEIDIKRLYELKEDPRYNEEIWKREIDEFLRIKKKSEQEAFARYGLTYIVDKYLPTKLKEMEK
ncbi:MAG: DNA topoisomerase IV subunit A [Nitrososphaeria archaeon]